MLASVPENFLSVLQGPGHFAIKLHASESFVFVYGACLGLLHLQITTKKGFSLHKNMKYSFNLQ